MNRADLMHHALRSGEERLPLINGKGETVAWTLVDSQHVDDLNELRWHRTHYGYAGVKFLGAYYYMHRVILDLSPGDPRQGDHINGDPLDNRLVNLRIVTRAENRQNQASTRGTSKHRGVSFHTASGKWRAQARFAGLRYDEVFDREEDAALAVSLWRKFHMPYANEERS